MEAEIWQRLPEELLYRILARLPIRVLGKMRTVCKQWKYLLSSRDTFEGLVPIWSLCSTSGFLIQIHWNSKDDVDSWVIEERCLDMYKVPLPHHIIIVNTCGNIFCCHRKGDMLDLSIGIPGTSNWRRLPRPPVPAFVFNGLAFDSSTRVCTLLLGRYSSSQRRIVMCIYDSKSNDWTQVSMMVPDHVRPSGKGCYCNGKFYWVSMPLNRIPNLMVAFNIADGRWTEIPLPQRCKRICCENLGEYNGHVVLVEHKGHDCVRIWKLNEAEEWCDVNKNHLAKCSIPLFDSVAVNSSGLIMVMDREMNISIYNWNGKLIVWRMRLPGPRISQRPSRVSISSLESNNLWWS